MRLITLLFVSLFALAATPAVATSQGATATSSDFIKVAATDTGKAKPADAKKAKKAKKAGKAKAGAKK